MKKWIYLSKVTTHPLLLIEFTSTSPFGIPGSGFGDYFAGTHCE
jgi:hypothetical protein